MRIISSPVTYLIASGIFGNCFDAVDGPEWIPYFFQMGKSRSWAEIRARGKMRSQTWFGDEYAYILLHFTLTVALGISTPIIAPFGLLYLAVKHCVDSYRLRTRAVPTSVSIELHVLAMGFVIGAAVLLQFYNMLFFNLRVEKDEEVTNGSSATRADNEITAAALTSGFVAILSGAIFLLQVDSGWTWPIPVLPRQASKMERRTLRGKDIYRPSSYVTKEDRDRDSESSSDNDEFGFLRLSQDNDPDEQDEQNEEGTETKGRRVTFTRLSQYLRTISYPRRKSSRNKATQTGP